MGIEVMRPKKLLYVYNSICLLVIPHWKYNIINLCRSNVEYGQYYTTNKTAKIIWNIIEMIAKYKWCWIMRSKMIQKKTSSNFNLCVVLFSNFSFASYCIYFILKKYFFYFLYFYCNFIIFLRLILHFDIIIFIF